MITHLPPSSQGKDEKSQISSLPGPSLPGDHLLALETSEALKFLLGVFFGWHVDLSSLCLGGKLHVSTHYLFVSS